MQIKLKRKLQKITKIVKTRMSKIWLEHLSNWIGGDRNTECKSGVLRTLVSHMIWFIRNSRPTTKQKVIKYSWWGAYIGKMSGILISNLWQEQISTKHYIRATHIAISIYYYRIDV